MPGDNCRSLSDGFYLEGKHRGLERLPVVGYYTEGHIHAFIHSIHSFSLQVHGLFQSQFSTDCNLVFNFQYPLFY